MDALKCFEEHKLVAVIRSSSAEDAEEMIKAAASGGIRIFEVSMQTPQAVRILETHAKQEGFLFGAGSVLDGEMAQRAINAGAKFLASHYTDREIVNVAKNNDNFVIQGALTPTEAFTAYQFGADLVRIYPAEAAGGAAYLKHLKSALPFAKLAADGEVEPDHLPDLLKHCLAVFLSRSLFDKSLIRSDKWADLAERAKQFTQKLESLKVTK